MALINSPAPISSSAPTNKKTFIIAGIAIFGIAIVGALIAGILFPASAPQTATNTPGGQSGISGVPTGASSSIVPTNQPDVTDVPLPTVGDTKNGTAPIQFYYPEPTVDIDSLLPTKKVTPTPTPLPGPFYIANGKQNDLTIRLYQREDWDSLVEVQLINQRTTEVRIIGYSYEAAPGDSAYFSKDFSQVIFLGGSKTDYQRISIYSIPQKTIIKEISLAEIKQKLPGIQIQPTATLGRMALSPDGKKVALSYGNTYYIANIQPNTYMMAINLATKKMQLLPARGLVRNWKDDTTIEYETPSGTPNTNTVQELKVTGL